MQQQGGIEMLDLKAPHVSKVFAEFAADAESHAKREPLGFSKKKLVVPPGEKEAVHNLWAAPGGLADLHVWLAHPGNYDVDGADRPNFFEVTSIMVGHCIVEEKGHPSVELRAGDTYVMRPGWTGRWTVREYVEKAFIWVYV
jgi:uncharacterized cupin superfamily protein